MASVFSGVAHVAGGERLPERVEPRLIASVSSTVRERRYDEPSPTEIVLRHPPVRIERGEPELHPPAYRVGTEVVIAHVVAVPETAAVPNPRTPSSLTITDRPHPIGRARIRTLRDPDRREPIVRERQRSRGEHLRASALELPPPSRYPLTVRDRTWQLPYRLRRTGARHADLVLTRPYGRP